MTGPAPRAAGSRWSSLGLALGALVAVALLAAAALESYRDLATQRRREVELEEKIQAAERRIRTLEERIRRLKSDPETLERVAREELGLVRPEDLVVVFPEPPAEDPPEPEPGPHPDG